MQKILPQPFASYVLGHAAAIGVPVEMIALPFLANVGSLIGNRLAVQLKQGRLHYPTLWVGVVAPPGAAKTPALNACPPRARCPAGGMESTSTNVR